MAQHSVAEIVELASELRVPFARVNDGAGVLSEEHLGARDFFALTPEGFVAPRSPRMIDGEQPPIPGPAPTVGEHTGRIEPRSRPAAAAAMNGSADPIARPLAGIRVVDLTSWWAGPSATQAMALGADVIHVESVTHPDGMRLTGMMFGKQRWWEWGHMCGSVVDVDGVITCRRQAAGVVFADAVSLGTVGDVWEPASL